MTPAPASPRSGLIGWHFLAMIVSFFVVVVTVDGAFAFLALKTHPGEVSVTPYEDGLLYNRHIAQMDAQAQLGWRAAAGVEQGRLIFDVRDRTGRPLSHLAIAGKLERPATEAGRITPRFSEIAPGRYEADTRGLAGTWDLTASATDGQGHVFIAERRLTWR